MVDGREVTMVQVSEESGPCFVNLGSNLGEGAADQLKPDSGRADVWADFKNDHGLEVSGCELYWMPMSQELQTRRQRLEFWTSACLQLSCCGH